jgi:hypothetical protein
MMLMTSPAPVRRVLAPDGSVLTLADLPRPDAPRWVASRKAIVVAAVRGGLLSMSDACARYRLTTEEFLNWIDARAYPMSAGQVLAPTLAGALEDRDTERRNRASAPRP